MVDDWRPIETLKGGEEVLLYYPATRTPRGDHQHSPMIRIGRHDTPRKATHWMPLPKPPNPS